jgi:hypothetical protein
MQRVPVAGRGLHQAVRVRHTDEAVHLQRPKEGQDVLHRQRAVHGPGEPFPTHTHHTHTTHPPTHPSAGCPFFLASISIRFSKKISSGFSSPGPRGG